MHCTYRSINRRPAIAWMLACTCWLAVSAVVRADELGDRLKVFRQAVAPHLKAIEPKPDDASAKPEVEARRRMQIGYVVQAVAGLAAQAESAAAQNLTRQIEELRRYPEMPAELKTLLEELARDLPKLLEQRAERWSAEIDALVKRVSPACLSAKTEADLDPLLRELGRAGGGSHGEVFGGEAGQRKYRRLQGAVQTVSTWQDYLAHLALGHTTGATAALKRLLENSSYPIIALAEIEQRMSAPPSKEAPTEDRLAIVSRVERIEDLEKVLEEIRRAAPAERDGSDKSILDTLERVVADYTTMRAGYYSEAFRSVSGDRHTGYVIPAPWKAQVARLRGLLLVKVLPRYLELLDISLPAAGEVGSDYLLRLIDELIAKRRFADTVRVIETYRALVFGPGTQEPAWIATDLEGLRSFAAADRFADVGLWAEAINSFRRATETTGRFTPSADAAKRMAELSQKHPEEARAAERMAESDAAYMRMSRDAARALESRLPSDIRNRMQRYPPGFPP